MRIRRGIRAGKEPSVRIEFEECRTRGATERRRDLKRGHHSYEHIIGE